MGDIFLMSILMSIQMSMEVVFDHVLWQCLTVCDDCDDLLW